MTTICWSSLLPALKNAERQPSPPNTSKKPDPNKKNETYHIDAALSVYTRRFRNEDPETAPVCISNQ